MWGDGPAQNITNHCLFDYTTPSLETSHPNVGFKWNPWKCSKNCHGVCISIRLRSAGSVFGEILRADRKHNRGLESNKRVLKIKHRQNKWMLDSPEEHFQAGGSIWVLITPGFFLYTNVFSVTKETQIPSLRQSRPPCRGRGCSTPQTRTDARRSVRGERGVRLSTQSLHYGV